MPATIKIWDVEHGACAMITHSQSNRLAMVDSGHNQTENWRPSDYIRRFHGARLDYLFITNADQDHMSDLAGLRDAGIVVSTLTRNPAVSADNLERIKRDGGPLTRDAEEFLRLHRSYTHPIGEPFDANMGGITQVSFYNSHPEFTDTNNLSLAVFFRYNGFKILFPGDLECAGWRALLRNQAFVDELAGTTILVASHHGRENGYCDDVFDYCSPRAVVFSDKSVVHTTQETTDRYRQVVADPGVLVATTKKWRRVLTTRRDGHISFVVQDDGSFYVHTETQG